MLLSESFGSSKWSLWDLLLVSSALFDLTRPPSQLIVMEKLHITSSSKGAPLPS